MENNYVPVTQNNLNELFITPMEGYESHPNGHTLLFLRGGATQYWRLYYDGEFMYLAEYESRIKDDHVREVCYYFTLLHDPFRRHVHLEDPFNKPIVKENDATK